ncbi:GntR family transcriptional regulator [Crenobacter luteus]|uniref:GntR family transcriptional regulator n=1 Tax=Crenobacter luteus TaxID=1452487 RepID=A0A165FAU6_9NEIS|nr:GntR family transcriptional regulator [Crenobacter luteus]KZE32652.1 GntR family transcriptional regulator [Crenobacter luteus]TCP10838.1 GntR family transcriptional regulator [Crenobacter luteus]
MTFKANDSLTEQIARYLGRKIIEGDMPPGERIQELRVAAELEVSRGSIREALLILQRRHLVDIYPRRGAVVAAISRDAMRDFFELWFWLLDKLFADLASGWQDGELDAFDARLATLAECAAAGDWRRYYETGVELLGALYDRCRNRYLQELLADLLPQSQRCLYVILKGGAASMAHTLALLNTLFEQVRARRLDAVRATVAEFCRAYTELAEASLPQLGAPR